MCYDGNKKILIIGGGNPYWKVNLKYKMSKLSKIWKMECI